MMIEFDKLLLYLRVILEDNIQVVDNKIKLRSGCKYQLFNLMAELDKEWLKGVLKDLDYNGDI